MTSLRLLDDGLGAASRSLSVIVGCGLCDMYHVLSLENDTKQSNIIIVIMSELKEIKIFSSEELRKFRIQKHWTNLTPELQTLYDVWRQMLENAIKEQGDKAMVVVPAPSVEWSMLHIFSPTSAVSHLYNLFLEQGIDIKRHRGDSRLTCDCEDKAMPECCSFIYKMCCFRQYKLEMEHKCPIRYISLTLSKSYGHINELEYDRKLQFMMRELDNSSQQSQQSHESLYPLLSKERN